MYLWVIFGTSFGLLAAMMSFLITYQEYSRHFLSKRQPLKMAVEIALVTFLLFFGLCVVLGLWWTE
jgi:hypothetical protein